MRPANWAPAPCTGDSAAVDGVPSSRSVSPSSRPSVCPRIGRTQTSVRSTIRPPTARSRRPISAAAVRGRPTHHSSNIPACANAVARTALQAGPSVSVSPALRWRTYDSYRPSYDATRLAGSGVSQSKVPHTATTSDSDASDATRRRSVSGTTQTPALRNATSSPRATSKPRLSAYAVPRGSPGRRTTTSACVAATAAESSELASSTTISSQHSRGRSLARSASSDLAMTSADWRVGTTTERNGDCITTVYSRRLEVDQSENEEKLAPADGRTPPTVVSDALACGSSPRYARIASARSAFNARDTPPGAPDAMARSRAGRVASLASSSTKITTSPAAALAPSARSSARLVSGAAGTNFTFAADFRATIAGGTAPPRTTTSSAPEPLHCCTSALRERSSAARGCCDATTTETVGPRDPRALRF